MDSILNNRIATIFSKLRFNFTKKNLQNNLYSHKNSRKINNKFALNADDLFPFFAKLCPVSYVEEAVESVFDSRGSGRDGNPFTQDPNNMMDGEERSIQGFRIRL